MNGLFEVKEKVDILPCPFCGGEAEIVYTNDNHHSPYTQCKFGSMLTPKCPCSCMPSRNYKTEQEAIEAWNRRTCSCKKQED